MTIYFNDCTSCRFKEPLDKCEKFGELGFYATYVDGEKAVVLWANIKHICLV